MNSRIRQFLRDEWLQLLLLVLPMVAALAAMPFATEWVPMQWNLRGQVNWYAPKEWGLLVLPVAMLLAYGIVFWREARDSDRVVAEQGKLSSHGKATRTIRLTLSFAAMGICFVQIASALGRHPDVGRLATVICPLLLAFVGNFFGKLKPNRYIGIRVPWTLKSETVWRKTHRVAGWVYMVTGLVAAALSMLVPSQYLTEIGVAWLGLIILLPLLVAWHAAREERLAPSQPPKLSLGWLALVEALVLLAIIGMYFQTVVADPKHAPERKAAQAGAEQWLVHLDESRYEDAWRATGSSFRKVVAQPQEVKSLNQYRKPLGAKLSRTLREASYKDSLPHAPPGKYVVVRFDTVFEHQADAIETVVEELEKDGRWQVSGYFIK